MTAASGRWGIVATIKAPRRQILEFCAYHLLAGATRIHVFLDDPSSDAFSPLQSHPKITVRRCDAVHWARLAGGRPERHQHRQTRNANRAYRQAGDLDWLIHMDCDEFLLPVESGMHIADILANLPASVLCARVRPVEMLAGAPTLFKRAVPRNDDYDVVMARLYPEWGEFVKAGFLSHVLGKLFVRTGQDTMRLRIHNVQRDGMENPGLVELSGVELAHCHATDAGHFLANYRYRLKKGSYRSDLGPNRPRDAGGVTKHELFTAIERESGEAGLRAFFREIAHARPELVEGLRQEGLLREADLQLQDAMATVFPSEV